MTESFRAAAALLSLPPTPQPESPMTRAARLVTLVSKSLINVILTGETGVGKDVFARQIHERSPRAAAPFVAINCGALAETLLESELFGYEKGAFTGATQSKIGLLEAACGGTAFLDEVGDMPLSTQVKLLRAIESREVVPVGGTRARKFDARFLAATHRDLRAMAREGTFREDLFYRLNGLTLRIPPLRERRDEIVSLVAYFLSTLGVESSALSASGLAALEAYHWPGNVRELRNVAERACLFAEGGVIERDHVEMAFAVDRAEDEAAPPSSGIWAHPGVDAKRSELIRALEAAHGNQTLAAKTLGLTRRAVQRRMVKYKISGPRVSRL